MLLAERFRYFNRENYIAVKKQRFQLRNFFSDRMILIIELLLIGIAIVTLVVTALFGQSAGMRITPALEKLYITEAASTIRIDWF